MFFRKNKFPTKLFVIASLAVFLLVLLLFLIFHFLFLVSDTKIINNYNKHDINDNSLKNNINDPYITLSPNFKNSIKEPIINGKDPILGSEKALVSLIVFSDFSCNFCARQEDVLQKIMSKYGNQINLIWKDYPLDNLESESFKAAKAARCAQEQNSFWSFHDLLFKNQSQRRNDDFLEFAKKLDLDKNKFENCLKSEEINQKIKNNILEANALGIYGVPFIYVNNLEFVGGINENELSRIIDMELEKIDNSGI